ncbi:MAG: hypothetical protein Kow00127_13800 [Bacteroidales bacterium]
MRKLSQIIWLLLPVVLSAQSPHGDALTISCDQCHNSKSWKLVKGEYQFDHSTISFSLTGTHAEVDCKDCHKTLVFNEASQECASCHTDMHQTTLGSDCAFCHNTQSWIVNNITEIHQQGRFPLLGAHAEAECFQCHKTISNLTFEPLGIECIDCHREDYESAQNPDHVASGFSTDCIECHTINGNSWTGGDINHSFFPLVEGHDINECSACHTGPGFEGLSTSCADCHSDNYQAANNPNHVELGLPMNCDLCHTLAPGWRPASFSDHDPIFPIYSGKHNGEWDACTDCHTNPSNYSVFTCIYCHEHRQSKMDDEHNEVSGYVYESNACLECHPTGDKENVFNHATTAFPLTGAHVSAVCTDCHEAGYQNTPTDCGECHQADFEQSADPNHVEAGIPNDCASCHTTDPGWTPATFPIHDDYYPLTGAHVGPDCFDCHQGTYTTTPNLCAGCHLNEFNQTSDPDHQQAGFTQECETCHTTNPGWTPANFEGHNDLFPLTGGHDGLNCADCHEQGYVNTPNVCAECHLDDYNQTTDPNHIEEGFPQECEVCHTTNPGWSPANFSGHDEFYPLTGAHTSVSCFDCHQGNYTNTPNECAGCHIDNYNQATNPNHTALGLTNDCAYCHTTNPDWQPAAFPDHNSYYELLGAHAAAAGDCFACHQGNYNSTPNTCYGCHASDYNQANDPPHQSAQFPTDCELCHSQNSWEPSTFNHDAQYFPIYSGEHEGEWDQCSDCHTNPSNYSIFTCLTCHQEGEMWDEHQGVSGYVYNSQACLDCHPDGGGGKSKFNRR